MANKQRQDRNRRHGDDAYTDDTSGKRRLEHLRLAFEAFRREHRPGTRIPRMLRDQALAAINSGTPEIEVLRACRILPLQLNWWQRAQRSCAQEFEVREGGARVFPVVDNVSAIAVERASEHQWQDLELRIGQWAISIRQLQS